MLEPFADLATRYGPAGALLGALAVLLAAGVIALRVAS